VESKDQECRSEGIGKEKEYLNDGQERVLETGKEV
jgi:hypothetical protein